MAVSIVIGGQYGSEGKGKTACFWADRIGAAAAVRVGGSNSGHTVYDKDGKQFIFRMLPTAAILDDVKCILPAGSYIDIDVLNAEIKNAGLSDNRLLIDPNAVIIDESDKSVEKEANLRASIGSTMSGTGAAVVKRVKRDRNDPALLARDVPVLQKYLCDTKKVMREMLDQDKNIVIEGTQGYGLSNLHAKEYPYATSRDTSAAGFLSETGLSPFDVDHIVMTIRAFPIRVAGNSGNLVNEIDWKTVSEESGSPEYFEEKTTVTHNVRRVARFDKEIVSEAITANNPDVIIMNHVDYIDYGNRGKDNLSYKQNQFVKDIEKELGRRIDYCGNDEYSLVKVHKGEETSYEKSSII